MPKALNSDGVDIAYVEGNVFVNTTVATHHNATDFTIQIDKNIPTNPAISKHDLDTETHISDHAGVICGSFQSLPDC